MPYCFSHVLSYSFGEPRFHLLFPPLAGDVWRGSDRDPLAVKSSWRVFGFASGVRVIPLILGLLVRVGMGKLIAAVPFLSIPGRLLQIMVVLALLVLAAAQVGALTLPLGWPIRWGQGVVRKLGKVVPAGDVRWSRFIPSLGSVERNRSGPAWSWTSVRW